MRKQGADDKAREFVGQLRELENTIQLAVERISEQIRASLKAMGLKIRRIGMGGYKLDLCIIIQKFLRGAMNE